MDDSEKTLKVGTLCMAVINEALNWPFYDTGTQVKVSKRHSLKGNKTITLTIIAELVQ